MDNETTDDAPMGHARLSRWLPTECKQFLRPRHQWTAEPMPYRALPRCLEGEFKPAFREWEQPGSPAESGPVAGYEIRHRHRRRIRDNEGFAARLGIGQHGRDRGVEVL